jgi:hypothetical protein
MENSNIAIPKASLTSIDSLLKKSLAIYKIIFVQSIQMSLLGVLAVVPTMIIVAIIAIGNVSTDSSEGFPMSINIALGILALIAAVFGLVVSFISQVGLQIIVYKKDAKLTLKNAFLSAKAKAWRFFSTSLLAGAIILLGFVLFIVPGIIWSVYYSFISWVILKEGLGGMKAVRRSKYLVKDYWWAVFGRLLLLTILMWFVFGFLSTPSMFMEEGSIAASIYDMIIQVFQWIATPFSLAYSYYIYKDLKNIKDSQTQTEVPVSVEAEK